MRKINIKKTVLLNIPYVFIALLATKIGQGWRLAPGSDFASKMLHLLEGFQAAFRTALPSFHPTDLLIGVLLALILRLAVYIKGRNAKKFRKNMEYGSARWGTHEDIAPYEDPVFENNIILTQTECLMMSNRPKDPKTARNKNVLVVGGSGSGKTRFFIKPNLMQLHSSYVVTDPKGSILVECGKLLERNHYRIKVFNTINFKKSMHYNPLSLKSDFVLSLCELIVGGKEGLQPVEKTIIDRCVRLIYRNYLNDPRPENMPILQDLYDELRRQDEKEANYLATALEIYVTGSLNVFNHRTNVDIKSRVVAYDIKELGKQLKKIGMLIVQDQVWNRVTVNREAHKSTRYYIDEMHLLLREEQTAAYTVEIWKRFRKWGGVPTGITQNVKDLLSSREVENIFENSDYIYMLNQAAGDRQILSKQLNISTHQLSYVTHSGEGEGLLFYGNIILPFTDHFPRDTELYRIMTTKPQEVAEQ